MVGQELDGHHQDGSPPSARYLRHEVDEVRLHPLAGLVTGTLPAERPLPFRQAGAFGHRSCGRSKLGEVIRLSLRHEPRQAVGGHEDAHRLALVGRESVERIADATCEGSDKGRLLVPGPGARDLGRRIAE